MCQALAIFLEVYLLIRRPNSKSLADESAQVHILEMVTLFWLFFMTATFIIQIHIPDNSSIATDSSLDLAAEDSLRMALIQPASDSQYENLLTELLADDNRSAACELILAGLTPTFDGECWFAKNSQPATVHGDGFEPFGKSAVVHKLLSVDSDLWTITVDVWQSGGGV